MVPVGIDRAAGGASPRTLASGTSPARRIVRFFGTRGDLLVAEAPNINVYDSNGDVRVRVQVEDFLDIAPVGDELWVAAANRLTRLSAHDGSILATDPIEYLDPTGRVLLSSTAPQLPVWHASQPVVVRVDPVRTETPGPGGELILPLSDGRWLLWAGGQLRLWRSIGEAWRKPIGEPGSRPYDAQLVLDGRLFVFAQQRPLRPDAGADGFELRLTVAQVSDGAQNTQLRLPSVTQLAIAARRGLAVARTGDRLSMIDLRFGRWIRDLVIPEGTTEIAIDDGLQRIALLTSNGLELVRPDSLASPATSGSDDSEPTVAPEVTETETETAAETNGESHPSAVEVIADSAPPREVPPAIV